MVRHSLNLPLKLRHTITYLLTFLWRWGAGWLTFDGEAYDDLYLTVRCRMSTFDGEAEDNLPLTVRQRSFILLRIVHVSKSSYQSWLLGSLSCFSHITTLATTRAYNHMLNKMDLHVPVHHWRFQVHVRHKITRPCSPKHSPNYRSQNHAFIWTT